MKFIDCLSLTKFRKTSFSILLCILTVFMLMTIFAWASDINIPNTFNKTYMSDPVSLTFTSADTIKSIKINGYGNTDTILLQLPSMWNNPTATLHLVNNATVTYYNSSVMADDDVHAITISKPLNGITTATISLSTGAGSGGGTATLQFYIVPTPSR